MILPAYTFLAFSLAVAMAFSALTLACFGHVYGVLVKRMTMNAMCFSWFCEPSLSEKLGADSSPYVFCSRHWFKVPWVNTSPDSTQMIQLKSWCYGADEVFVCDAVSGGYTLAASPFPDASVATGECATEDPTTVWHQPNLVQDTINHRLLGRHAVGILLLGKHP